MTNTTTIVAKNKMNLYDVDVDVDENDDNGGGGRLRSTRLVVNLDDDIEQGGRHHQQQQRRQRQVIDLDNIDQERGEGGGGGQQRRQVAARDPPQQQQQEQQHKEERHDNEHENEEDDSNTIVRLLLHIGLVANIALLVGGCMFVIFFIREIINFCQRDLFSDILYWVGFLGFTSNAILELYIDLKWTRSYYNKHGRYSSDNRYINILIGVLFLIASVVDVIGFMFWRDVEIRQEHLCQWIASHLWLITATIVLTFSEYPKISTTTTASTRTAAAAAAPSSSIATAATRMDSIGNIFFMFEAIMICVARYSSIGNFDALNLLEFKLELCGSIFWVGSATSYIIGDIIRFKSQKQRTSC